MGKVAQLERTFIQNYLSDYVFPENNDLFNPKKTIIEFAEIEGNVFPKFINEFWTSKQRQANSIHEIAYRACFKPQLPNFFINILTKPKDIIYDPFSGRGTTILEAGLLNRNIIANDISPLSKILSYARFFPPEINQLEERLRLIPFNDRVKTDIDLTMFYHPKTEAEVISLREYLKNRKANDEEDELDSWIRMVATNRLTGHSKGFFSVYTLPPNQAVSQESQRRINRKRNLIPDYRDTKELILNKTKSLTKDLNTLLIKSLREAGEKSVFLNEDARYTKRIKKNAVQLTVTSPPFLDIVQYDEDNWLRCWFNSIAPSEIDGKITMSKKIEDWRSVMGEVLEELFRITKPGGYVAFEVGEVRKGKIRLDEHVVPLGLRAGFDCEGIVINSQTFTKTSNIWGINNNNHGTNTNRIVLFKKAS